MSKCEKGKSSKKFVWKICDLFINPFILIYLVIIIYISLKSHIMFKLQMKFVVLEATTFQLNMVPSWRWAEIDECYDSSEVNFSKFRSQDLLPPITFNSPVVDYIRIHSEQWKLNSQPRYWVTVKREPRIWSYRRRHATLYNLTAYVAEDHSDFQLDESQSCATVKWEGLLD